MTWWWPDYLPSDHEMEIQKLFSVVDSGARDFPADRTLLICFTNRSGSTFLGEALAATGSVKPAREYLNHPVVRRQSTQRGITSFDAYIIDLAERFGHKGILTLKAGLGQLYYLAKLGFLGDLMKHPAFVLIERDDTLAQAVSWAIAHQTGQWKSTQQTSDEPVEYDFDMIDSRIDAILAEGAAFRAFFARNGCEVEFVTYEHLKSNPAVVVAELAANLGLESGHYREDEIEIAPQRSLINTEWKTRYLTESKNR
jgi:LPS sulfotransferase NodH